MRSARDTYRELLHLDAVAAGVSWDMRSLLLILGAVVLLVLGLVNGASTARRSIGTRPACRGFGGAHRPKARTAAGLLDEDDDQYDRDDEDELIDRRVGAPHGGSAA